MRSEATDGGRSRPRERDSFHRSAHGDRTRHHSRDQDVEHLCFVDHPLLLVVKLIGFQRSHVSNLATESDSVASIGLQEC